MQFCTWADIQDVVTAAIFGRNRFRRFRTAEFEFQVFPLTFKSLSCVVLLCQHVMVKWLHVGVSHSADIKLKMQEWNYREESAVFSTPADSFRE